MLKPKLALKPGETDLIAMQHRFIIEINGKKYLRKSSMIEIGEKNGMSAMGLTVSSPTAIGAELILEGKIKERGVLRPIYKDIYEPCLERLAKLGVRLVEEEEEIWYKSIHIFSTVFNLSETYSLQYLNYRSLFIGLLLIVTGRIRQKPTFHCWSCILVCFYIFVSLGFADASLLRVGVYYLIWFLIVVEVRGVFILISFVNASHSFCMVDWSSKTTWIHYLLMGIGHDIYFFWSVPYFSCFVHYHFRLHLLGLVIFESYSKLEVFDDLAMHRFLFGSFLSFFSLAFAHFLYFKCIFFWYFGRWSYDYGDIFIFLK